MKKNKQKTDAIQTRAPQFGRLTLLVGALVATGVLSPLSLPEAVAAPLPMPCGGCGNLAGTSTPIQFVQSGAVTLSNANPTNLTINQTSQVAILNWQQFNIDKGYSVEFKQPNSTSSALNRIWDANPTTIAGSLTANGQIYLVNQNGIVFANGAQVNTNTLIATSLVITDKLFNDGYMTNLGSAVIPAFSGVGGFVKVETGAVLNGSRIMMFAPVVENNGTINTPDGQTVLAAGHKIYLEASQDPNLRGVLVEVDVNNPGVADPLLAGYGLQHTEAGVVTNAGYIFTKRGNTTLVGFAVNQQGRISASTSVYDNGSIKLLARYGVQGATGVAADLQSVYNTTSKTYDIRATQTGKVTLVAGSRTAVTPELADTATTNDGQGFNKSVVEVMGNTIDMQSGSKIIVPGGKVTLAAISSFDSALKSGLNPGTNLAYQEIVAPSKEHPNISTSFINPDYIPSSANNDSARVFLDSGSLIDVSGSSANVSVARNILTVQLRGAQLKDAPVQRTDRFLWGKDVQIDIRKGTTLADYAAEETSQIVRTVAERTSAGGSVKLVSTGDVVMKSGAKIDLSGGQLNYTGARINATTLVSEGVVYDIANASPDRIYTGISNTYTVDHKKWGISETFTSMAGGDSRGRWDAGYVEGKSAGTLTILAPHAVIDGDIVAKTVAGIYQRQAFDPSMLAANNYKNTWQMMPQGGSLIIGNSAALADESSGLVNYTNNSSVTIQNGTTKLANSFSLFDSVTNGVSALPANLQQDIFLDTALFNGASGLSRVAVYSNKTVTIAEGTTLKLATGGAITLQGETVNMLGSIEVPAGTVKLGTAITDPVGLRPGALNVGAAGTNSYILTRGQWVNDSALFGLPDWSKPLLVNGGNINLSSAGDLLVASGTKLDASGGASLDTKGKYTGGNGGAITLASGKPLGTPFKAQLDGLDLRSYGTAGGKGGSLTIKASEIVLGGTATNGELALPAAFFQNGGFTSYNLTAQGSNLTVAAGTTIEPRAQSLVLDRSASKQASGSDVNTFASVALLPEWQRKATSITLNASKGGSLKVDTGAVIRVDPTASINLIASNQLTVLGTLDARAGVIDLSLDSSVLAYSPTRSIWLGSQSKLLSQGYFMQSQPNAQNLTQGQVLAGGKINISTNVSATTSDPGYVVAQQGSLMDVSSTSADLDLPQLVSGQLVYQRSHIAGDAGSISVQTGLGALFDGTMTAGVEAGSHAAAGNFSLTLNNNPGLTSTGTPSAVPGYQDPQYATLQNPAQIQLMASGNGGFARQAGLIAGDDSAAGKAALDALAGKALLDASALQKSGFDQIKLKSDSSILLDGQVDLITRRSLTLDAPQLLVNGKSSISSAYVSLGSLAPGFQLAPAPVKGAGVLNVSGKMVDLTGNFIVSGIRELNINSDSDIRLKGVIDSTATSLTGSLRTQGNVTLQADQIYPSTLANFKISVVDDSGAQAGSITVLPGQHSPNVVMSAGGQLTLSAADIVQNGVVKAPLGTVNLNGSQSVTLGAGSLTSVSANGLTIPFGFVEGGNTWKYDLSGSGAYVTIDAPPQKQVKLTAPKINNLSGSTIDLSGGGDLYAYEFFAGSGGSVNVLDPVKAPANTFAIIPGLSGYSPYDPQASGQYSQADTKTTLQVGASVYLAGGAGIKAGYYTLLPASYALLPEAYRVTAVSGYTDRQPEQGVTKLTDGSQIMAGKLSVVGTGIQDARYSGFMLTPGAVVRTQSEFHDSYANQFFSAQAASNGTAVPRLANDAGQLIISAVGSGATLALDGAINAQAGTGGRAALVDLSGPGFDIVNTIGTTTGRVQLTTSSLNKLGAESLLIGGVRTQSSTGMNITVGASDVVVDNAGSVLSGPEIILAATNAVTVKSGSVIEGKGTLTGLASNINIGSASVKGDGALLRVSSAEQVSVTRKNLTGAVATLSVENGATLGAKDESITQAGAQNAVLLDSSYATTVGKTSKINAKSFSVAAQNIDIGQNPAPALTSLALAGDLLAQALTFKDLTLHSYNDINFYGDASLIGANANRLSNLVLDARSLNGLKGSNNLVVTNVIDATNITLLNSNTGTSVVPAYSANKLTIKADQITLGAGDKSIQGFDTVTLEAKNQIVAQGKGSVAIVSGTGDLDTTGAPNIHSLVLEAGQITGTNKSDLTITASNDVISIKPVANATASSNEALNAKLKIEGQRIEDDGVINLPAGSVTLHATGSDITDAKGTIIRSLKLGNGSKTAATGFSKTISGQTAYAQAGSVSLISDIGGIDIQSGAEVDVSGAVGGGDAGSLNVTATKGVVSVAGNLNGVAAAEFKQGSFVLDANLLTGSAANALTGLNDTLTTGSFNNLRDIRVRTGNLVLDADVAGSVRAKAQIFRLTADDAAVGNGNIVVNGKIGSAGQGGGSILLAAVNNITLNAGLDAHDSSEAGGGGGKVILATKAGKIDLNNQNIDVHDTVDKDGIVSGGSVLLRVPRNATNTDVALFNTGGTKLNVSANAEVVIEGFKTYVAPGILDTTEVSGTKAGLAFKTEALNFASAANIDAMKTRLGMWKLDSVTGLPLLDANGLRIPVDTNQHLRPGVELTSTGDMTLAKNLDLSGWRFNDGNGNVIEPGILTLKAIGNLNFGTVVPTVKSTNITTTPTIAGAELGITTITATVLKTAATSTATTILTTTVTTTDVQAATTTKKVVVTDVATTTASLTDGFTAPAANNNITLANGKATIKPTDTASWSYRLVAGADSSSADVMAVKSTVTTAGVMPTKGNVMLVAGYEPYKEGESLSKAYSGNKTFNMEQIRTGTGFIDIAAGGNLGLGNRDSVIYTAGLASSASGLPTGGSYKYYFGEKGGDISIRVKGDVIGAATDELITDWQWRQGVSSAGEISTQPAWWINLSSFRQNIGTLGGGNVSVVAGGNINNLSAVAATSGYVNMGDATHPTVVLGGGDVNVTAGGNINSGLFYVGNGHGNINAGGDLGTTRQYTITNDTTKITNTYYLSTLLALGQGSFDVRAGGDLTLESVFNPTVLPKSYSQNPTGLPGSGVTLAKSYFFTYGQNSGVSLSSLSGNVSFKDFVSTAAIVNTKNSTKGFFYLDNTDILAASVYPGTLNATALGGNVVSTGAYSLYPTAGGNLQFVAAKDIKLSGEIIMSDAAPGGFLASSPTTSVSALVSALKTMHSSVHVNDELPVVLSAGGSIGNSSVDTAITLILPKKAQIEAGLDVQNLGLTVQNMKSIDTTSIVANRDIAYTATNSTASKTSIKVNGPGQVVLQAGRNVDLGQSGGVVTEGNLSNPLLNEQGASVTVLAGVGQGATATQSFIDKYIDPAANTTHGADLIAYVSNYGAPQNQTAGQAFTTFSSLSKHLQNAFARQVFFGELRSSGRNAVTTKNYQAGLDAIATLFPSGGYMGDVNLYYSQIKTVRGGDINIFTPGGGVNAGLVNQPANAPKKEAYELGIVTVKGGDINAFVDKDFMVNQSRVFTLQGGNILLWSSNGDIDAGKGSKSVSSTPPPLLLVDLATGTFKVDATRSVVGSGIAVLLANKDVIPGSVDLIAPNGTVNAGDAGIRSAGDIFIAATRVIGGDNISFGGAGAGVPVAAPAPISVGLGNLTDASKAADQATQSLASVSDMNAKDFKPTFLSVEVIGMGDQESSL